MTKIIGENIYLLGYTGSPDTVIHMSNKIFELYGDVDKDMLESVLHDYMSGIVEFKYNFNISHITKALREKGLITLAEKDKNEKSGTNWSKMVM